MDDTAMDNRVVVPATSNITAEANEKSVTKRHVFPKITKEKLVKGERIVTNPFLEKSTEAELAFCRLLGVEKPFIAPYGTKTAAWKDFCALLNEQRDDKNELLFDPPVTNRYAKERFSDYLSFVKQKIATTPLKSGCDDEEAPSPLLQMIEKMYKLNESFNTDAKRKKEAVVMNIDMDQDTPVPFASSIGNGSSVSSISDTSTGKSRSSGVTISSSMVECVNSFVAITKRHLDLVAEKEANKKRKIEAKLKVDEEKLLIRAEKAKTKANLQEEKRKNYEEKRKDKEFRREQKRKDMEFRQEEMRKEKEAERERNKTMLDAVMLALHAKSPQK
jgi:hypothetical protein